jgi:hypothetical protein
MLSGLNQAWRGEVLLDDLARCKNDVRVVNTFRKLTEMQPVSESQTEATYYAHDVMDFLQAYLFSQKHGMSCREAHVVKESVDFFREVIDE